MHRCLQAARPPAAPLPLWCLLGGTPAGAPCLAYTRIGASLGMHTHGQLACTLHTPTVPVAATLQVPVANHAAAWWQHAGEALAAECARASRAEVPLSGLEARRQRRKEYQALYAASHVTTPGFQVGAGCPQLPTSAALVWCCCRAATGGCALLPSSLFWRVSGSVQRAALPNLWVSVLFSAPAGAGAALVAAAARAAGGGGGAAALGGPGGAAHCRGGGAFQVGVPRRAV